MRCAPGARGWAPRFLDGPKTPREDGGQRLASFPERGSGESEGPRGSRREGHGPGEWSRRGGRR